MIDAIAVVLIGLGFWFVAFVWLGLSPHEAAWAVVAVFVAATVVALGITARRRL